MNTQAINICNTAQTAGTVVILSAPAYLMDGSCEAERNDYLNIVHKALTAYRVCKEAMLDYGIALLENPLESIKGLDGSLATKLVAAQHQLQLLISEAREKAEALENISQELEDSAVFKLTLAQQLLDQLFVRTAMLEPHKAAKNLSDLNTAHASITEQLEIAKRLTGNDTTTALLRSAEYFLAEYDKSRVEAKREFDAYTKAIADNLTDEVQEPNLSGVFSALFGAFTGHEDTPKYGRTSSMSSYVQLAEHELSTAQSLIEQAIQLSD